jgi:hypothetical protein
MEEASKTGIEVQASITRRETVRLTSLEKSGLEGA